VPIARLPVRISIRGIVTAGVLFLILFVALRRGGSGNSIQAVSQGPPKLAHAEAQQSNDTATSRLAHSIGMSTDDLSMWRGIVKQVGGSAEEANSMFATLTDTMMSYRMGAEMPPGEFWSLLRRAGLDLRSKPSKVAPAIAAYLGQERERGNMTPGEQRMWLMQVPGMNQGMLNAMMKGTRGLEEIAAARKAGAEDEESGKIGYGTAASATFAIECGIVRALQGGMPSGPFATLLGSAGALTNEPERDTTQDHGLS
jgi:hypothetical protein